MGIQAVKKPRWIVVAGPRRTGSTLLYNIIRLALPGRRSSIGLVDAWVCDRLALVRPEVDTVVKVHDWIVGAMPETVCYVVSVRNPADTKSSLTRFPETRDRVEQEMSNAENVYHNLLSDAVVFRYEAYFQSPIQTLRRLVTNLEIEADDRLLLHIQNVLDPKRLQATTDARFEMRRDHISKTLGEPGHGPAIDLAPYPAWRALVGA